MSIEAPSYEAPVSTTGNFSSGKSAIKGLSLAALVSATVVSGCDSAGRSADDNNNNFGADAGNEESDSGFSDSGTTVTDIGSSDTGVVVPPDFDDDSDGIPNSKDRCRYVPDIIDRETGLGFDPDKDGVPDACDNCLGNINSGQEDRDGDGFGDICDNAPDNPNPGQGDDDLDRAANGFDNCPNIPNPEQADADGDKVGDLCDCAPDDANIYPDAADVPCDGIDNACKGYGTVTFTDPANSEVFIAGEIDCECIVGVARTTSFDRGECKEGFDVCVPDGNGGSRFVEFSPAWYPEPEVADGKDNDCDGAVDNGVAGCTPGTEQPCREELPAPCAPGAQTCGADSTWSECQGGAAPATDDPCDGVDNDCDGHTDEAYNIGAVCRGNGECKDGNIECADTFTTRCSADIGGSNDKSAPEICDGLDNDCNNIIDDVQFSIYGAIENQRARPGDLCTLPGICGNGAFICKDDSHVECSTSARRQLLVDDLETPAYCNELDDNCNGTTDEGCNCSHNETMSCGSDVGRCNPGTMECFNGQWNNNNCGGPNFVGPSPERCNGLDDNCDGVIDNLQAGTVGTECGTGQCAGGTLECDGENGLKCSTMPSGSRDRSSAEACDGADNNCNYQADENGVCGQPIDEDAGLPQPEDAGSPPGDLGLPPLPPPPPPPPFK